MKFSCRKKLLRCILYSTIADVCIIVITFVCCILRDYYMTFSISALVSARDSHIKPDSEAGGLIWIEGWYQGRYGKFHVIIYLSHILHWLFPSIDFYIADKIFELTNCENKSLRELPLFNLQIFLYTIFPCTLTYNVWHHCTDTGSWIWGQIRTYEGKYGYLRAIRDICRYLPWGQITNTDFYLLSHILLK